MGRNEQETRQCDKLRSRIASDPQSGASSLGPSASVRTPIAGSKGTPQGGGSGPFSPMPSRIIRESCRTSPNLDQLSDGAERLFWRLTTVADDHGRFDADPRVVLAACFPLKVGNISVETITIFLKELESTQLVRMYEVESRRYGHFVTWQKHQRQRDTKPKHPDPPAATRRKSRPSAARVIGYREGVIGDGEGKAAATTPPSGQEQPHQTIINRFLELKGTPRTNLTRDQVGGAYKRHSRSALALIKEAGGLIHAQTALECAAAYFDRKHLTWTLDTIAKHLPNISRYGQELAGAKHGLNAKQLDQFHKLATWLQSKTQPPGGGQGDRIAHAGVPDPGT